MGERVVVIADIEGIQGYVYPCDALDASEDIGLPAAPGGIGFTRTKERAKVFADMEQAREAMRPWETLLGPDKHGEDRFYWEAYGEGTATFSDIFGNASS